MASLIIRELDEAVKERLRVRAAENGRSMEAEARAILATAVSGSRPSRGLGSHIRDQFRAIGGVDLNIAARTDPARTVDFS